MVSHPASLGYPIDGNHHIMIIPLNIPIVDEISSCWSNTTWTTPPCQPYPDVSSGPSWGIAGTVRCLKNHPPGVGQLRSEFEMAAKEPEVFLKTTKQIFSKFHAFHVNSGLINHGKPVGFIVSSLRKSLNCRRNLSMPCEKPSPVWCVAKTGKDLAKGLLFSSRFFGFILFSHLKREIPDTKIPLVFYIIYCR